MSVRGAPRWVRAVAEDARGRNESRPEDCPLPASRTAEHARDGVSSAFCLLALLILIPIVPSTASAQPSPSTAPRVADSAAHTSADAALRRARNAFEYGDFQASVDVLSNLSNSGVLVLEQDRIDAYRLLGLSLFYLGRRDEAANAFFDLLKQNPDYQLDPFYVPPHAVAYFDEVKKESEPLLAPIRERRTRRILEQRAEEEARREAERLRQEQLAKQTPPEEDGTFVVRLIERRVVQNSPLVAWMPFGLGQFQNGHPQLGTAFLATEAAAAAVSILSFIAVEGLRDPETGKFSAPAYGLARQLDTVKWVTAGLFYGLWLVGAIDANLRFVPSRVIAEGPPGPAPVHTPPAVAPQAARSRSSAGGDATPRRTPSEAAIPASTTGENSPVEPSVGDGDEASATHATTPESASLETATPETATTELEP